MASRKRAVDPELERMRHPDAQRGAAALQAFWPEAQFGVGPTPRAA